MDIFYDHQAFTLQKYGGISRYYCELIKGINNSHIHHAHLSALWSNNVHLGEYNISITQYPFPKRHRLLKFSNQLFNCIDSRIRNYDVCHATYFDDFLGNYVGSKPYVTTFHDMTYERLSHKFADLSNDKLIIYQKKNIAKRASHLIAVSENTKRDMIEILGITPEKITVIPLASSFPPMDYESKNSVKVPSFSYLLYVGNRSGYKNFIPFLRATAPLLVSNQINLICAGGGEFSNEEQILIQSLYIKELVKYKAINDIVLQNLYKDAIAFVFPSLYEGFGIPVLEAFSCNCPCLVSNVSSLPEVAGDAALYFDPTDLESMRSAISTVLVNADMRKYMIEKGRLRISQFSWKRTVDETLSLYRRFC